jgi:hypothetical protein
MSNRTWWGHNASHPSERDLLLFVNGEGGSKLARRVRDHVEGCWSCSLKRDRLATAIAAFMREREARLGAEDLSETSDRSFESRLRRLAQQTESLRAPSRPGTTTRQWFRLPVHSFVALSLAVAIAGLFWLRFSSVPSVSARDILNRVELAEASRIGAVSEPVIHQQFQVTRLTHGKAPERSHLETWLDPKNNRWWQETEEAAAVAGVVSPKTVPSRSQSRRNGPKADQGLVAELQDILKVNDLDERPISVTAFAAWRSKLRRADERVTRTALENGDQALTIATSVAEPLPRNAIVKSEFVVREQDWHPVRHRLSVSEPNGFRSYEIRETSFEVVALGSLGTSIFAPPVLPAPVTLPPTASNRLSPLENPIDPLELEISLLHRLHQAKACLGEEVQVYLGASGKPEVRGVVASVERKRQLTQLLAEFRDVGVNLQVPDHNEPFRPAVSSETLEVLPAVETAAPGGASPIKDHLLAHFAQLGLPAEAWLARSVDFSNRVIAQAESADLNAWELRRLAKRFSTASLEKLTPAAVAEFQAMARDNLRDLLSSVSRCHEMLRPVLASLGNDENASPRVLTSPATGGKGWTLSFLRVFESVTGADRLIFGLFDGSDSNASLFESSSTLLVSLPRILDDIRAAESELSELASASEPKVTSAHTSQRKVP